VGVDVGAARTKVAILDSRKNLLGYAVRRSGTDFGATSKACLNASLTLANASEKDIIRAVSTGYGRKNVPFTREYKTEIGCHAKGCFLYFPYAITIVDIGGQDNKIIKLDEGGRRLSFKMNRKCAAGTGAFLEEMSSRLDIPLGEMDDLARQSRNMVELGSYCTVFTATEVLEKIRQGKEMPDIVKGLFFSVIKRIMEMDSLTEKVVMTGGVVAHNPFLVEMIQAMISGEVVVPKYPQFTGAVGAALFAMDGSDKGGVLNDDQ
jgi:predicted CoA-substrate-specific enzyme activase